MPYTPEKRRKYERKRDRKRRLDPGRRHTRAEAARKRRAIKKVAEWPTFAGYEGSKPASELDYATSDLRDHMPMHGRKIEAFLREAWETDPALYIRVMTDIKALTDSELAARERRERDLKRPRNQVDSTVAEIVNTILILAEEQMTKQEHEDNTPPAGRRDQNGGLVVLVVPFGSFPEKRARAVKLGLTFEAILAEALRARRRAA